MIRAINSFTDYCPRVQSNALRSGASFWSKVARRRLFSAKAI
ncbi:MAG: hypothetical protein NTX50_16780 [Candidatus Sumerlaeota bacterium]|nr:hypothetical protein [Candidatus Sumerlaeota bacterium]